MKRPLAGTQICRRSHITWRNISRTALVSAWLLAACGSEPQKPVEQKPAEPVAPQEIQDAAKVLLGSDTEVLLFGDLAKTGKQQFLAANVVPNTPKSVVAGTVVRRAVVAEEDDGKWVELMRADEYLKNQNGYLALTPIQPVGGWKLQYENSPEKGMSLYFTPLKSGSSERTLPIAVRWNPATKRYQSMNLTYDKFLPEAASIQNVRSSLR